MKKSLAAVRSNILDFVDIVTCYYADDYGPSLIELLFALSLFG